MMRLQAAGANDAEEAADDVEIIEAGPMRESAGAREAKQLLKSLPRGMADHNGKNLDFGFAN
jgi:hypothetical protein